MVTEQEISNRGPRRIFREPERIINRYPVIDHQPRQQQPSRIAAPLVDTAGFPRELATGSRWAASATPVCAAEPTSVRHAKATTARIRTTFPTAIDHISRLVL